MKENPVAAPPAATREPGALGRRPDSETTPEQSTSDDIDVEASGGRKKLWPFSLRPDDDDGEQDWWFASTAIPLLAATTGPAANLLSIAALVTSWRNVYTDTGKDADSYGRPDPHWCIASNIASLVCGFVGNLFLLLNFTRRVRYIVALPMTIILWYAATILLITILVIMNKHDGPHRPKETYSQGFWHAVIAACVYLFSSMMLMINMMGYFLGHYPQHFTLTEHQRTLILQTMMFFVWLGGGAAVFSKVCGWQFVDALYFCDVTILTVGFGDFSAPNDVGRGLVFPFSVGGIITLGLVVGSLARFAKELSADKVLKRHVLKQRTLTVGRAVSTSHEYGRREEELKQKRLSVAVFSGNKASRQIQFDDQPRFGDYNDSKQGRSLTKRVSHSIAKSKVVQRTVSRKPKLLLLREEKDRFDAMRKIQRSSKKFKKWYSLTLSVFAFGLLWCVGAVVFMVAESKSQGLTYFQSLYFCYVSLLTIGYGDLSPKSNAGKPFFIIWSLIAVPTMTVLISDMSDTVIASFKRGTFTLADFTVLPQRGIWKNFLEKHPWLMLKLQKRAEEHAAAHRMAEGMPGPVDEELDAVPTIEELASGAPDEHHLARKLALAIRKTANDIHADPPKSYTYEEWVEFTRLIRFSSQSASEVEEAENDEGIIEWDWIGEDSPMLADLTEAEWVLDRLCESLDRHMRRQVRKMQNTVEEPIEEGSGSTLDWGERWNRDNLDQRISKEKQ